MHTADHARLATIDDAPRITAIYNQGIQDRIATFETSERTVDTVRSWFAQPYPIVVVERAGEVVAWASTSQYRPRDCYAGICEFSVYVDRAYRGKGAGRAAMQALFTAAEATGYHKLVSRVFVENTASRALLASLGFREVGVYHRHGQLDGVWRDVVIVEKLLAPESLWHPLTPGTHVTLTKVSSDPGKPDYSYPATVVPTERTGWTALETTWTLPDLDVHGVLFEHGGPIVEYFAPDRPYNIFHVHRADGASSGLYANVTLLPVLTRHEDGQLQLAWHDQWLDVVKRMDGSIEVLDEDELAASDADEPTRARIRAQCAELKALIESDDWPV